MPAPSPIDVGIPWSNSRVNEGPAILFVGSIEAHAGEKWVPRTPPSICDPLGQGLFIVTLSGSEESPPGVPMEMLRYAQSL